MKVNFNKEVTDLKGGVLKSNDKSVVTYKDLVVNALLYADQEDLKILGRVDKIKRYRLAEKIFRAEDEIEIDETERDLIIKSSEKFLSILAFARICKMLEFECDK